MELIELVRNLPLSSHKDDKVEQEAVALLEEFWFFDNLFNRKTKTMMRCNSDPCSSTTNFEQELVGNVEVSNTPMVNLLDDGVVSEDLLDVNINKVLSASSEDLRSKERIGKEENDSGVCLRTSIVEKPACNGLYRTPSLPPFLGLEELMIQDMENDHGLSKVVPQAWLKIPPKPLPPRTTCKGTTQTSITPGDRQRRISRVQSMNMDKIYKSRHQYLNQNKITRKSLSDLETEEVQGFKDLGFLFEKEYITPDVVDILPGLQEKKRVESDNNVRRPYLSEAWLPQRSSPPIPNWAAKRSTEDMKAHIKFWARAVASDVR